MDNANTTTVQLDAEQIREAQHALTERRMWLDKTADERELAGDRRRADNMRASADVCRAVLVALNAAREALVAQEAA